MLFIGHVGPIQSGLRPTARINMVRDEQASRTRIKYQGRKVTNVISKMLSMFNVMTTTILLWSINTQNDEFPLMEFSRGQI